jgi:hypothetical protein
MNTEQTGIAPRIAAGLLVAGLIAVVAFSLGVTPSIAEDAKVIPAPVIDEAPMSKA